MRSYILITPAKLVFVAVLVFSGIAQGTEVEMSFRGPCGAGWPSEQAVVDSGANAGEIITDCIPGDYRLAIVSVMGPTKTLIRGLHSFERGFGTTSGIFLTTTGAIDPTSLPTRNPIVDLPLPDVSLTTEPVGHADPAAGRGPGPSVFLIDVDRGTGERPNPEFLRLYPVFTGFEEGYRDASCPHACPPDNLLAIVPLQGVPLRPDTLYAAVVTNRVTDDRTEEPLRRNAVLSALIEHVHDPSASPRPAGITNRALAAYRNAIDALEIGVSDSYNGPAAFSSIVGLTVFKTGDPTAGFRRVVEAALSDPAVDTRLNFPLLLDPASPEEHLRKHYYDLEFLIEGEPDPVLGSLVAGEFVPGSLVMDDLDVRWHANWDVSARSGEGPGVFEEFCVFMSTISMPVYQRGPLGHHCEGAPCDLPVDHGQWIFDREGNPEIQETHRHVRIYVTLPRKPMPENGYPVVVFSRAGGGGEVPLVNRGPTYESPPDTVPALHFARAGWAAVQIDDPVGGWRRGLYDKTGPFEFCGNCYEPKWELGGENNARFDAQNLAATRDNIRQAALELVILAAKALPKISNAEDYPFDASQCTVRLPPPAGNGICTFSSDGNDPLFSTDAPGPRGIWSDCPTTDIPGPSQVRFDLDRIAYMGHSVGAHLGPLVLSAVDPRDDPREQLPIYRMGILSGASGSMLNNVLYKWLPNTSILFGEGYHSLRWVAGSHFMLGHRIAGTHEMQLNFFQYGQELADPPVYSRIIADRLWGGPDARPDRQYVLQFQGILDHYITPPIANAANLSLGLHLGVNDANPAGRDTDLATYDDRTSTGFPRWIDPTNGPFPNGSDYSTFMPYSDVIDYAAWGSDPSIGEVGGDLVTLPVEGRSALVQLDNGPLKLIDRPGVCHHDLGVYPGCLAGVLISHGRYPGYPLLDGHEVVFQSLQPKQQYQCFLETSLRGQPIIKDTSPTGNDYTTCCSHAPDVSGEALLSTCSECTARVCAASPECCSSSWGPECVAAARCRCSSPGDLPPKIQVPGDLHFPDTCGGSSSYATLDVCNTGDGDLCVDPIVSSDAQFAVSEPTGGYPVSVGPDFCFPFQASFDPASTGAQSATLTIHSTDSSSPSTNVQALGSGTEQNIEVTGSTDFGVTSAWSPAEKTVTVCNMGGCNLEVASAVIDCVDFSLVTDPLPVDLPAGSCIDLVVEFTPALPGPKSCRLTINSDDPHTPSVVRTLSARTPPFFSLHAGLVDPHGALSAVADSGSTIQLDFVKPITPKWAWDVRLGHSRFDGRPGVADTKLWSLSANARFMFNPAAAARLFLNGGLGLYQFDPGEFEGGGNLGLGLNVPVGGRFAFEATYNYHSAFTAAPNQAFDQLQLGFLVSF